MGIKTDVGFGLDPVRGVTHVGVNPRDALLAAPDAPGHDARLDVHARALHRLAHQGGPAVALARVETLLAASAHEGVVQLEEASEPSGSETLLTVIVGDDRESHFLEDVLEFSLLAELVLAPASGPAGVVVELLVCLREADGVHVGSQGNGAVKEEESEVVVESA